MRAAEKPALDFSGWTLLQLSRNKNVRESSRATSHQPLLLEELKRRGLRLTAQRRLLFGLIQNAREHLDAATLLQQAQTQQPRINRATVYRTIELLKKHGLIDELDLMHLDGEKHFYEVRTRRDHLHLACFECGRIEEFTSPLFEELKREITTRTGFQVAVTRVEVGGQCRACASKQTKGLSTGTEEVQEREKY
jgi:Fur family transcriptional regulator, ferric uptake regulator